MSDLIERLRARVTHEKTIPSMGHNAADRERTELITLLTEAAAALRLAKKEQLRDELARAAARIEALETENEQLRRPWWRRLLQRKAA